MESPPPQISLPPRTIPLSTRLVVTFGGTFARLGWLFGGFGSIFAIIFVGNADFSAFTGFAGKLETASGKVTAVEKTRASEGGNDHTSGTPIYLFHYDFTFSGEKFSGFSYKTGGSATVGELVDIEFPSGHPERSRIHGMRRAEFGPGVVFVLVFPLIGLGFIAYCFKAARKNFFLLVHGEYTVAQFISKEATNIEVNSKKVFKVWLEFVTANGSTQRIFIRTSSPEKFEDNELHPLFYDSKKPGQVTLLENIFGGVSLGQTGEIAASGFGKMFGVLWPPALGIAMSVAGILIKHAMSP